MAKTAASTAQPVKTIILNPLYQGHRDEVTFVQRLNETKRRALGRTHSGLPKIMSRIEAG